MTTRQQPYPPADGAFWLATPVHRIDSNDDLPADALTLPLVLAKGPRR